MIDVPKSFYTLAKSYYQRSHYDYETEEEWNSASVNGFLPPGPAREEVKRVLDELLASSYMQAELLQLWLESGSDYGSSDMRGWLTRIRAVFDKPYVRPKD